MNIPAHLIPENMTKEEHELFLEECMKLRAQIVQEYADEKYGHRTHFSHKTYNDGCNGPLCLAVHRVYTRNKRGGQASGYSKIYEPIVQSMGIQIEKELGLALTAAKNRVFEQAESQDIVVDEASLTG